MSTLSGHMPMSDYSLDGKGGNDSTLPHDEKTGKPMKNTGPNYVYYRLYTKLGAIESKHPAYSNDHFIGRIQSKSLAPPRTMASIKRYLCKFEGLSGPDKSLIFIPLSSPTPKEDSARLSLYAPSGPGFSEQDPIALVVESEARSTDVTLPENLPEHSDNQADIRYVHYRVYSSDGDKKSKTSFDESDVSLGRINTLLVAPPHTVGSLKASIAKVEGLVTPNHALYKNMELFEDLDSDTAMNDADILSFLGDTYPGSNEGDPMALVNATDNISVDQESTPDPTFTKRARLTMTYDYAKHNIPGWLPIISGEIVRTDGILVSRTSPKALNASYEGYIAINSAGNKGFVYTQYLKFI